MHPASGLPYSQRTAERPSLCVQDCMCEAHVQLAPAVLYRRERWEMPLVLALRQLLSCGDQLGLVKVPPALFKLHVRPGQRQSCAVQSTHSCLWAGQHSAPLHRRCRHTCRHAWATGLLQ